MYNEVTLAYTTGYAGTGKSTKLLQQLNDLPKQQTVVIAPTHKALYRLQQSPNYPQDIEIKTIHSLLGWIPTINEEAKHINHIDSTRKLDKDLPEYTHIVIDEAGMMSEDMLTEIISKIENQQNGKTIHLHLYLDPYQLLPVKGYQIQVDPHTTTNLTTQYRSESTDIVALYTKFVTYLQSPHKDLTTPYSENVLPLDIKQFKQGDRLLAYTNEAVGQWNIRIAKHLGITSYIGQPVQLGSLLDPVTPTEFITPSLQQLVDAFEDGTLVLQNRQIQKKYIEASMKQLIKQPNIKFITTTADKIYPVIVGIHKANKVRKTAKENALKDRAKFAQVYTLDRAFTLDYNFATTVHKSQGSEFNTVFVDKEDIQRCIRGTYYEQYARMMYVSISRARKTLYI